MEPTRRSLLGTAGAALLGGLALPWRPKPQDILIATHIPPPIERVSVAPRRPRIEEWHQGHEFTFHGTRFIVTAWNITERRDLIDMGWEREPVAGLRWLDLEISATSIGPPPMFEP